MSSWGLTPAQMPDAVEALDRCLARLDDDVSGAVVHRRDRAVREEAEDLAWSARRGEPTGALAGMCFTVKAAVRTGVMPATAGSLVLDERPGRAAPVVDRLRRAGALLVGVTNCAEFALVPIAENRRYGSTINPAAPRHTPGGSSAGCAAAVAGGLVPFSVGSDYGGSVRFPASCTGILGFRPGRGLVPTSGQVPPAPADSPRARFSVPGLLAVDVATLAAVLPAFIGRPVVPRQPRRVAWVDGDGDAPVDDVVAAAAEDVANRLGARHVDELGGNPLVGATRVFDRIRETDHLEPIRSLVADRADDLTDRMRAILAERPRAVDPDVERAAGGLRRAALRFLRRCPLLVAPVTTGPTPLAGVDTPFGMLGPSRAVSVLGVTALAVPAGSTRTGAPLGVQLIGSPAVVLWAARTLEVG